jgi:methionine-R-sulfoxide reductase
MDDLKKKLTPLQFAVTKENATEPPFNNEYWNNFEEGLYVDLISGEPLFSSKDKFDSGCGWPSFDKSLKENITSLDDFELGYKRTEVRSKDSDSHLGHVFNDGPTVTGVRFCINSASVRFIPKSNLKEEGYSEYISLFSS